MTPAAWLRDAAMYVMAMLALNASAIVAQDSASPLRTRLSETATARIEADGVAGAVIVVLRDGDPVWSGAFGDADPAAGRPMTTSTLFRVESLSKPVTAWGAMRLAEARMLDLDAPATNCLRRWQPVAHYVYPGRGSGGLLATASDMARFAAADMAGTHQPVLSQAGLTALHRPVTRVGGLFAFAADGYALGHFTETLSDGRRAIRHGGQGYGWMSHTHLVPETGDGIVILSNSQRAWPLFAAILRDLSESLGVAPVGMTRILWAERAARFAIGLALAVALLAVRFALVRRRPRALRIAAGIAAAALIFWPLWAAAQTYLFLFSILPGLWPWLGGASG